MVDLVTKKNFLKTFTRSNLHNFRERCILTCHSLNDVKSSSKETTVTTVRSRPPHALKSDRFGLANYSPIFHYPYALPSKYRSKENVLFHSPDKKDHFRYTLFDQSLITEEYFQRERENQRWNTKTFHVLLLIGKPIKNGGSYVRSAGRNRQSAIKRKATGSTRYKEAAFREKERKRERERRVCYAESSGWLTDEGAVEQPRELSRVFIEKRRARFYKLPLYKK